METLINNPWISGIGGSLISSVVVYFMSRYFFAQKRSREYAQKVKLADNEILYTVRPLIIDGKTPLNECFSSLLLSVSKKYEVKIEDIYNAETLSEDLITEILQNPFLTSEQKEDLSKIILQFKHSETSRFTAKDERLEITIPPYRYASQSLILAILTFAVLFIASLYLDLHDEFNAEDKPIGYYVVIFVLGIIIYFAYSSLRETFKVLLDKLRKLRNKENSVS